MIEEQDLDAVAAPEAERLPVPPAWQTTFWGDPMPDVVAALRRSRHGH
jgi:hypothetical protein